MDLNLATIGNGALAEKFGVEMAKVISNIADPNTNAKAVRTISMKVKIKPNDDRCICGMEIDCSSSMAPPKTVVSQVIVGVDSEGNCHAKENLPDQQSLFPEPSNQNQTTGTVTHISSAKS